MVTQKHPQRHRTRNTACPALQGYAGQMQLLTGTADRAGALLALALLGVTLTLSGCSSGLVGGAQSNGDPGGRGLAQLRGDPVFGSVPPDLSAQPPVATPATHRPAGLDGGGDDAPAVSRDLTSSSAPARVFAFYDQLATSHGWTTAGQNYAGQPNSWRKTFPSQLKAVLQLIDLDQRQTRPGALHHYALNCGTATT